MKDFIRVVGKQFPKHGRHIGGGKYEYVVAADGVPTMRFRWRGIMFNGSMTTFVFPRDVVKIGPISDDVAKSQARSAAFNDWSSRGAAGLIVNLAAGAIGAAAARTTGIKGFGVYYNNEQGHLGLFTAVASPEIVDAIFRSVSEEKHIKDTSPPVAAQDTEQPNA
jgi:hypothetical protein